MVLNRLENPRDRRRIVTMQPRELFSEGFLIEAVEGLPRGGFNPDMVAEPIRLARWAHRVSEECTAAEHHMHRLARGGQVRPSSSLRNPRCSTTSPRPSSRSTARPSLISEFLHRACEIQEMQMAHLRAWLELPTGAVAYETQPGPDGNQPGPGAPRPSSSAAALLHHNRAAEHVHPADDRDFS